VFTVEPGDHSTAATKDDGAFVPLDQIQERSVNLLGVPPDLGFAGFLNFLDFDIVLFFPSAGTTPPATCERHLFLQ
jgi:hypothetical protein